MKTLTTQNLALLLCLTILVFTSCKKEDEDVPQSTPAVKSNVTNPTPVQTVNATYYTVSTWVFDKLTNEYQGYIINPAITEEILKNGVVQVLVQDINSKYLPLPINSYEKLYTINYSLELNLVKIEMQYQDLGQGPKPGNIRFKIATISN